MKKVVMIMLTAAFLSATVAIAQDKKDDKCPKSKTECPQKKDCPKDKKCCDKKECPQKKDCPQTKK